MDYFRNTYKYTWKDIDELNALNKYLDENIVGGDGKVEVTFKTPTLWCQGALTSGGGFVDLCQMQVFTQVYRTELKKIELVGNKYNYQELYGTITTIATFKSGPTAITNANNAAYFANDGVSFLRRIKSESKRQQNVKAGVWSDHYVTSQDTYRLSAVLPPAENYEYVTLKIDPLTEQELEDGKAYKYDVVCFALPVDKNAMLTTYEATHTGWDLTAYGMPITILNYNWDIITTVANVADYLSVKITTSFYQQDKDIETGGGLFITKGQQYSCYNLLRKALLTCDTYVIDNDVTGLDEYDRLGQPQQSLPHSIILDPTEEWENRLKTTIMHETIFEAKNLWEVLLQIGQYLHAIPYLEFADNDKFILRFRQLGKSEVKTDESTKITVFNSKNLSEYFTQYDSYVENLFSPQNIVEEWLVAKTSDNSFLVSNDTAELHTSYGIIELLDFQISLKIGGVWETRSAIEHIFERSIYDILSNADPYKISPCKGSSLYYSLGDKKIQGLNFVPPSVFTGDRLMSLKMIVKVLFGAGVNTDNLTFNDLKFYVKYHTQDNARITQFRPDLDKFMKNSEFEKYPHHEQFYGQQDKIVDSERFTANLYGKLIRVANDLYQIQEYAATGVEKESGDLVKIGNENFYVTETENEYYPDAIFQKVTYSKNFNQLSNIVTIPSEPRFYEVSERSKIRREIRLFDFFKLTTTPPEQGKQYVARFLSTINTGKVLKDMLFYDSEPSYPNYAWTRFRTDRKRLHRNQSGEDVADEQMFPSSLIDTSDPNNITPLQPSDRAECIVPLLHFPLRNGIIFTWEMVDNFKAADFVSEPIGGSGLGDDAYMAMQPLRYVDIFGRADLFEFKLFTKTDWTIEQMRKLPQALDPAEMLYLYPLAQSDPRGGGMVVALDKDCREELSFNYQIVLLHSASESSGNDFLTYPNLFGQKNGRLKMCIIDKPQGLFDDNLNLSSANILADDVQYSLSLGLADNVLKVEIPEVAVDLAEVGAIVLYDEKPLNGQIGERTVYIIKNVANLPNNLKLRNWYIYPIFEN